jgi:hypothetical protein
MTSRGASVFPVWLLLGTLAVQAAQPDASSTATRAVTATPPLQVVPAIQGGSKNVQQRMRGCNAAADAKKLPAASRETFIKTCMTPRRTHPVLRPGSQPKANP